MARFVENRFRCAIDPGKKSSPFKDVLNNSNTLVGFKDAAMALEFALFNGASLYDITNILSVSLLVTDGDGNAVIAVKTLLGAQLNPALTLDENNVKRWTNYEDGDEHGIFEFTQDEMAVAAGTYEVTVFGVTEKGRAVFGISKLRIIDRHITNFIAAPPPGVQYATVADLAGLNAQSVKLGQNLPGKSFTLVNADGTKGVRIYVSDDGALVPEPFDL